MEILSKQELEEHARQCLIHILGFNERNLLHKDKPDIQNATESIGIEVVEDVYPNEKANERFWCFYETTPVDLIPDRDLKSYYNRGGTLTISGNHLSGGRLGEKTQNKPDHLILTIKDKLIKLNQGCYAGYKTNILYVFVSTVSLFNSYVISVMKEIVGQPVEENFDVLVLDGYYEICFCDLRTLTYRRIPVSQEKRDEIRRKTKAIIHYTSV